MATSGDILLAIREDFYMATDRSDLEVRSPRWRRTLSRATHTPRLHHVSVIWPISCRPPGWSTFAKSRGPMLRLERLLDDCAWQPDRARRKIVEHREARPFGGRITGQHTPRAAANQHGVKPGSLRWTMSLSRRSPT